ncbi:MAG: haloacid dehalogenase [Melioribacteraceae bacterium]|nr:MAG: haloacid dehalogenase [Melioribacteraceae bacterium]
MNDIKYVAFDADDTLWVNEPYFRDTEDQYCELLKEYGTPKEISEALFKTEMNNLALYGYGIKSFTLSMIENALRVSEGKVPQEVISGILALSKKMLNEKLVLLEGVAEVVESLFGSYHLIVATKGDLLDQERKLKKSGLEKYFHHVEIMSEKKPEDYQKLLNHLDIKPSRFLMIGNSLKSDILPVLEIGGYGFHIPFHTTWQHEKNVDKLPDSEKFKELSTIKDVLDEL